MNDKFHLEINSFDEFIKFVEIIRGKEIDLKAIKKLTESLSSGRESLEEAIKENKNG